MSHPPSGAGTFRRLRSSSMASHSSPRLIPCSSASADGTCNATDDVSTSSFQVASETQISAISPAAASGQREPTRSFIHLSYRGALGIQIIFTVPSVHLLIVSAAPSDSAQYAKSVREDTAELASYALSDKASLQSTSSTGRRSSQTQLESSFQQTADSESAASNRDIEGSRPDIIEEVSEPVSPDEGGLGKSPGTSMLADLLRRSPPSRSSSDSEEEGGGKGLHSEEEDEVDSHQERLIITSSGVNLDATERTPLLGKDDPSESHHPDWIRGQQDLEGQELRRKVSWPKLRNVVNWPGEKGYDIARVIANPKAWDRRAIWENTVVAPVACLPAVVLGLLLNILDALSYGMFNLRSRGQRNDGEDHFDLYFHALRIPLTALQE